MRRNLDRKRRNLILFEPLRSNIHALISLTRFLPRQILDNLAQVTTRILVERSRFAATTPPILPLPDFEDDLFLVRL